MKPKFETGEKVFVVSDQMFGTIHPFDQKMRVRLNNCGYGLIFESCMIQPEGIFYWIKLNMGHGHKGYAFGDQMIKHETELRVS